MQIQVHAIHYYLPVKDSHFAFAKHPRLLIQLDKSGRHCHAFRGRSGEWQVSVRDVMKNRITDWERKAINAHLSNLVSPAGMS